MHISVLLISLFTFLIIRFSFLMSFLFSEANLFDMSIDFHRLHYIFSALSNSLQNNLLPIFPLNNDCILLTILPTYRLLYIPLHSFYIWLFLIPLLTTNRAYLSICIFLITFKAIFVEHMGAI